MAAIPFTLRISISAKQLSRQLQLFLGRELPVEGFHVCIVHIIGLGRLVHAGDAVQISRDQFSAQEKGIVLPLWQAVVADAKPTGISKAAFSIETNTPGRYC